VVPDEMPVTTPLVFIVPTDVVLLLHTPPLVEFDNVILPPTHTLFAPVIAETIGNEFTTTVVV
jgi:hypothetical protein